VSRIVTARPLTREAFAGFGDVIETDGDLYGDGVNIAARLQTQAPAGGIVISSTVHDHVRNKLSVGFDFLGELTVKNVHDAIPSYSVRVGAAAQSGDTPRGRPPPRPEERPPEPPPSDPAAALDGISGKHGKFLPALGVVAAGLLLVNIVTWHGTLWASWPILFLAALAGFIWSRRRHGAVSRFGPPAILAATLLGINILSGAQTLWAQWPILAIAAVSFFRWSRRGPGNSRPPQ